MNNRFLLYLVLILGTSLSFALPEEVKNWTSVSKISQLEQQDGAVWAATDGGVFRYKDFKSKKWTSSEGLGATQMCGVVHTDQGKILAIAKNGLISQYKPNLDRFEIIHTDFNNSQRNVIEGGVATGGNYLFVAFKDQISIFDIPKNRSIYSLQKINSISLKNENIQKIELVSTTQDSLFIYTENSTYVTRINLTDIDQSFDDNGQWQNIADPSIWEEVDISLRATSNVSAKDSAFWQSGGMTAPNPNFLVDFTQIIRVGDQLFAGGYSSLLAKYNGTKWSLHQFETLPFYVPFEITADDIGRVYINAMDNDTMLGVGANFFRKNLDDEWSIIGRNDFYGEAPKSFSKNLKTIGLTSNGTLINGGWGGGITLVKGATLAEGPFVTKVLNGLYDDCLSNAGAFFSVIPALYYNEDQDEVWFHAEKNTGSILGFLDVNENVSCIEFPSGSRQLNHLSRLNDGSFLILGPDSSYNFQVTGEFESRKISMIQVMNSSHIPNPIKALEDQRSRLWFLGGSGLYTYCNTNNDTGLCPEGIGDSLLNVTIQLNLPQKSFRDMEVDAFGNLYIASDAGLIQISTSSVEVLNSSVKKITAADGIASDEIYNIALNSKSGDIWLTHLRAISQIKSQVKLINEETNTGLIPVAYPTPFKLAKHEFLTIKDLAYDSEVLILNSARSIVKKFAPSETQGGYLRWDGNSQGGKKVSSGVYYISIKEKGGKSHLLKIVLIR